MKKVSEGCENQRWPLAAHVLRPATENGNPGVINEVNKTESRSATRISPLRRNSNTSTPPTGGERQETEFWALVQNSAGGGKTETFAEPSTLAGDQAAEGNSNCEDSVYVAKAGEKFPPESTREGLVESQSRKGVENVTRSVA